MKLHTTLGADTLRDVHVHYSGNGFLRMGIEVAQSHHERWDGAGYPEGLVGEDIPLSARIVRVADVYDAIRSERTYKPAGTREDAERCILAGSGTQFDPDIVDAFSACAAEFEELWRET